MILQISECLDPSDLDAIREACAAAGFASGSGTAGRAAGTVKNNLQAGDGPEVRGALELVERRLRTAPLVRAAARPRDFARLTLSRYDPGMEYGRHVDNAFIAGRRTDLSFTLFLTGPDDYAGGELVLEDTTGERTWKLAAGDLLLYPSTTLHRVEPVTTGTRLVVVGWIRSRVREAERREILFDLEHATREEFDHHGKSDQYDRLSKTFNNLMRMWAN